MSIAVEAVSVQCSELHVIPCMPISEPVNNCFVFSQSEYAWAWVSWLWAWRDATNFDKPETDFKEANVSLPVFIETGRQTEWVFKR